MPSAIIDNMMAKHQVPCMLSSSSQESSSSGASASSNDDSESEDDEPSPSPAHSVPPMGEGNTEGEVRVEGQDMDVEEEMMLQQQAPRSLVTLPPLQQLWLWGRRYGLNTIKNDRERRQCMDSIKIDMEALLEWSKAVYKAGRPSELRSLGKNSLESLRQRVHEFLGYLYNFKEVARPSLDEYVDEQHFSDFMDFVQERGLDKPGHTSLQCMLPTGWQAGCRLSLAGTRSRPSWLQGG